MVISHDRYFLNGFVNRVWEVNGGAVKEYYGNYSAYEWAKAREIEQIDTSSVSVKGPSFAKLTKEKKRKEAEERNKRYKNLKPLQARLQKVESRLEVLMQNNEDLQEKLSESSIYEAEKKAELLKTLEEQTLLRAEEKKMMTDWHELTVAIEEIENPDSKNL